MRLWCGKYSIVVFALRFTGRTAKCKWPLVCFICVYSFESFVVLQSYGLWCVQRLLRTEISFMVRGLIRDTAINQVDPPRCETELRFVWLSRGLRLPSEASFCGAFPLRRMFLPKAATFALHDPRSDGFATDFCEARYRLRSGNAPKRSGGQVAEGDREAIRKYLRESINHRSFSTLFIAVSIETSGRVIVGFHFGTVSCGTWNKLE